ncbi:hypothetical protein N7535_009533 [Penicillium sp. DV-2018c]|nr:hypothetical protein N7461_002015 [Penicillium sp. DV-2018c]KAJ5559305.1 hypothetical protein N7535_009533 [Penicillium sp. DV-2018c]
MNSRHLVSSLEYAAKMKASHLRSGAEQMQVGSSNSGTSSQAASPLEHVDPAWSSLLASPEDDTVRLVSCVIRHILYFAPPQDGAILPAVLELRDANSNLSAHTPQLQRKVIAIDDGGLIYRQHHRHEITGLCIVAKSRVVVLEAKRQFQSLEKGRPIISDNCFAQMTCEALVARLADPSKVLSIVKRVIVIHAVQHYLCFLDFHISDEYLADFESDAPSCYLRVSATEWFDLSPKRGRKLVATNLCGIMHWARQW